MSTEEIKRFCHEVRSSFNELTYKDVVDLKRILRELERDPVQKQDQKSAKAEQGPSSKGVSRDEAALKLAEALERVRILKDSVPKISYPSQLPVSGKREEIIKAIRDHQVVIIAGETGSGKTTQIPKMCLEAGLGIRGMIGHTQPRRIAARAVASRIAEELGQSLGDCVGYKVRFTDVTSEHCLIKLMTDGILLAETASDRLLLSYDCIIIDEAHERSLNIDFLLGYLKNLLPRRPELKLIITSATIDPKRFAKHFNDAPVIEVSGRTYPVDVVYAPLEEFTGDEEDEESRVTDLRAGILKAFKYLQEDCGRGDTLVFLPGERDIMDTAAFLSRAHLPGVEVVPLFARLAAAEQNKIFSDHAGVRIVLATNIAETSLTVPGIRYVIDPGTARISRYSPRTKVQRLPVEKISQASANQRKGRCGRVSNGVCVRLYSEDDFNARPLYTDPEILRTNLAAVILQMVALRLGNVSDFPFIDAPEPRQISDGMRLLEELGAVKNARGKDSSEVTLTKTGIMLSKIPADPRLARMLLESVRYGALSEVLVIVAALAVMDPREHPLDKQEQSRQLHKRFQDEKSDFLAYLSLYRYIRDLEVSSTRSAFQRTLKKEFISYLRVREWFDVLRQLRSSCKVLKLNFNDPSVSPADYEAVHRSLLPGLLSQCGTVDSNEKGIYWGARGIKFVIHPSSALSKKNPKWVCAAELSETSRLFARTVAEIKPEWLEWSARHLIKKSYAEPHWSKRQGACEAELSVTLYGLRLVQGRRTLYTEVEPARCRELLIRSGLVEGEFNGNYEFLKHNRALVDDVIELEDKQRRRDLLVDESVMQEFYDKRLPADIVTQRHFDRWWKQKSKEDKHYLDYTRDLLLRGDEKNQAGLFPEFWQQGNLRLPLSYVFDPTAKNDGVSVHIPLTVLNQIKSSEFAWQIPGLRAEFLSALIKSLPKRLRRNLIPAPDYAAALNESVGSDLSGSLWERCAKELTRMGGEIVHADDFDRTQIPSHLFMTFVIEDAKGKEVASGKSFELLADRLQGKVREALQSAVKSDANAKKESSWNFGTIKKTRVTKQGSMELTAYQALTDKGQGVSLELYDSEYKAQKAMWKGQRRLLVLSLKQPVAYLEAHLPNKAKLSMYYTPIGSVKDLIADIMEAAVDAIMQKEGAPVWDEEGFKRLSDKVRGELNERSLEIAGEVEEILKYAHELKRRLKCRIQLNAAMSYQDIGRQLDALVYKGFVSATSSEHLKQIPRYLQAALQRLDKVSRDVNRDLSCSRTLDMLRERLKNAVSRYPKDNIPHDLSEVRWMIEELRVSYFAQQLGVRGQISDKRIIHEIERILKEQPPLR